MLRLNWRKPIQKSSITSPTNFPSGIAVKTDKDTYWIKDGKRYKLISSRAADSWSFTTVDATESALSGFKLAGKLGFRDGTLIKNIADGRIYLVSQNKLKELKILEYSKKMTSKYYTKKLIFSILVDAWYTTRSQSLSKMLR